MISVNLETIISESPFFKGIKLSEQKKIFNLIQTMPMKENIKSIPVKVAADTIFLVCRGEVTINAIDMDDNSKLLNTIKAGDAWFGNELDIVKTKKIIINVEPKTILMQLRLSDLYYQLDYRPIFFKVAKNLGINHEELPAQVIPEESELLLFNQNELERRVVSTQYFVKTVLILVCTYILFLHILEYIVARAGSTVPVTLGFLSFCLLCYYMVLRRAHIPSSFVGLSITNTRVAVKEALIGAPPLLFLALVFKWIMIHLVPSLHGEPLINIQGTIAQIGGWESYLAAMATYTLLSVPLQELILRGGVQGCLEMLFAGRKNSWQPLVVANTLFASIHIIISPFASLVIFFPGLYWGWLFSRHHNLIGVCVSHAIFGGSAFFVIGYLDVLKL